MKHVETDHKPYAIELKNIKAQLVAAQKPFLDTLDTLADTKKGRIGLCFLAAYAIGEGLAKTMQSPYSGSVQRMSIYFNKIYVGGLKDREIFGFHGIFELKKGKDSLVFIDPTYRQIDDAFLDKFLIFTPEKLGLCYTTELKPGDQWKLNVAKKPITKKDLHNISEEKDEYLTYMHETFGISKNGYEALVRIVKGNI